MPLKLLKRIRVILAILFFALTFVALIDFSNLLPPEAIRSILYLQFSPSLLKFLEVAGFVSLGFIFIMALTLLIGRLYCSSICPLGILQDLFLRAAKGFRKRRKMRHSYHKAPNPMRYSILIITIILLIAGSSFMVLLLDPYSNFGRIQANITRPIALMANNLAAILLEQFNSYALARTPLKGYNWAAGAFALFFLLVIAYTSVRRGRWFCNYMCPVGTLLGLFSKYSLFKVRLNQSTCTDCKACVRSCKAECIDLKTHQIDYSRCVDCFNCLEVCKYDAIHFTALQPPKPAVMAQGAPLIPPADTTRRSFLLGALTLAGAAFGMRNLVRAQNAAVVPKPKQDTTIPEEKTFAVSPPGSLSIRHFTERCTACHLCVSVCPTQVLQPSLLEFGFEGIFQPHMDYHAGFCNYECTLCADVCPTGAILPIDLLRKKREQIGVAKFIKESCVVYTDNTLCGACNEHCPTKAVKMIPYKGDLLIPKMQDDQCIGCGACENVCPTRPFRAIYIDGNQIHITANEPDKAVFDREVVEEFPF